MDQLEVLQAMREPDFYPDHPNRVEVQETHISTLFFTDRSVYKVKKPVDFGFLDYTTLNARKYFCEQELLLNQRLSREVYLKVLPIYQREKEISLDPPGKIVEYAVLMRRLPQERMMDVLLREGRIDDESIRRIALHLIGFHSRTETGPEISIYGTSKRIFKNTEENFTQTAPFVDKTITREQFNRVRKFTHDFLNQSRPLLERRIQEKKIRDCHGDIRPEHICVEDPIVIFDCVEFNRRFRYSDVAADLAFLAMDLDFFGYPELSRHLIRIYVNYTHDLDLLRIIRFYKCYRAYVRGKVDSFKSIDPHVTAGEADEARTRAQKYFSLAETYARERPYLAITCGLTGTGKSLLASRLARDLRAKLYRSDQVRKELAGISPEEHRLDPFGRGLYSKEMTEKTYRSLLEKAEEQLGRNRPVLLDATFLRSSEREQARSLSKRMKIPFFILEARCPDELVRERLEKRMGEKTDPSDGRWEIYTAQKKIFEPITGLPPENHLVISTADRGDPFFRIEMSILLEVEA
jgi:aminoglycoside phosphotransferase family enzyme/predicted kinase